MPAIKNEAAHTLSGSSLRLRKRTIMGRWMRTLTPLWLAAAAFGQDRPNFSGTWELTAVDGRLSSGETHVFLHEEPKLTINMTLHEFSNSTVDLTYSTDGKTGPVGHLNRTDGTNTAITGSARWEGQTLVYEQLYPNRKPNQPTRIIRYLLLEKAGAGMSARQVYWLEGREEKLEAVWTFTRRTTTPECPTTTCSSVLLPAPKEWFLAGDQPQQYDYSVNPKSSYNGLPSTYLKSKAGIETKGFGTLMYSLDAASFERKRVRFRADVKSEGVESRGSDQAWAGLWMRVDGNDPGASGGPQTLAFDNMRGTGLERSITGTRGWQSYSVVLDVPEGATRISLGILLAGSGSVWLSGEKFEAVGRDVQVTVRSTRPIPEAPTNLNFEKTLSVDGVPAPAEWDTTHAGSKPREYNYRIDPAAYEGQPSAFIKSKEGVKTTGFGTLMQSFSAARYSGNRLRLSANLKSTDVEQWCGMWMRIDGTNSSTLAFDNMHDGIKDRSLKGTTGWNNYSVILDVPEGATSISIGFLIAGPGTFWANGMKLEVVGPEFPVTGKLTAEPVNAELASFIKEGNVIQDPDEPVSFRLSPGWTLTILDRTGYRQKWLYFTETGSNIRAVLIYRPRSGAYPANTSAALRQGMEDKLRERQGRDGMKDYRIRPGSVQTRLVGGHPAISFIGEISTPALKFADYTVQILGKSTWAEFKVINPPTAGIEEFSKRFDLIVNSLRIP